MNVEVIIHYFCSSPTKTRVLVVKCDYERLMKHYDILKGLIMSICKSKITSAHIYTFENAFTTFFWGNCTIELVCATFHHHTVKLFCTGAVIEYKACKDGRLPASVCTQTSLWQLCKTKITDMSRRGARSFHFQISGQLNETLLWIYLTYLSEQRGVEPQ